MALDDRDDHDGPAQTVATVRLRWPRIPYRHLIGPTFFPVYLLVLKLALGVTVVVTAGYAVLGPTGDAEFRPRLVEVAAFSSSAVSSRSEQQRSRSPLSTSVSRASFLRRVGIRDSCRQSYDSKMHTRERVATNVCLDAIAHDGRRVRSSAS